MKTDPLEIVNEFTCSPAEYHPCPININDHYWLKKLCALAERCAEAENTLRKAKEALAEAAHQMRNEYPHTFEREIGLCEEVITDIEEALE